MSAPAWILATLGLMLAMNGCESPTRNQQAQLDRDLAQLNAQRAEAELVEAKARAEIAKAELDEAKARAEIVALRSAEAAP